MVHNLVIFDSDEAYARNFANYVNMQKSFPFEVRYFSKSEDLVRYTDSNDIDIIMASENVIADVNEECCRILIRISNDKVGNVISDGAIYKYQSCEQIIKDILMLVAESPEINKLTNRKNEMVIIGNYSPVKNAGQTQLAIAIGQLLSRDFRVLYINLEGNSGLEELLGTYFSVDLSDLMYDIQNGNKDVSATIGSCVHNRGGLDIFPIMRDFRDLSGMKFDDWKQLLRKLETDTNYDYILLDISDTVNEIPELLSVCNKVLMVKREDIISQAKIKHFTDIMEEEYKENIMNKTVECLVPFSDKKNSVFEINSEIGDYGKQVISEAGLR